jgi:truncated hemoglobin YjbI
MSANEIRQKIQIVEEALRDAGTEQAIRAIIDVLKEIAATLENPAKTTGGPPQ